MTSSGPSETGALSAAARKLVILALAMGGFTIGVTEFAAMGVLPAFSAGLQIDEPTAGHVISAYALGVVVGAPVLATLGARFSRRLMLIGLMALFALANGLSALAPSYEWMLFFRFLSGVPHGAYFGVAALVAADVALPGKRSQTVATLLLGLSMATIIGVPFAGFVSLAFGWRWTFGIVAILALLTMILVVAFAPHDPPRPEARPLRELGALKNGQVWLTLSVGAIGFGGLFAVYAYLASTLLGDAKADPKVVPLALSVFGVGMLAGNMVGGWAADRFGMKAAGAYLVWAAFALGLYSISTHNLWTASAAVLLVGTGGGLATILQTRLMDVAGDAQTLAAALNHSAFNTANALGPWLAGMAVAAGYGWSSTGLVGCGLAIAGFVLWVVAYVDGRRRGYA